MIRKFNYTNRRKINRESISISVQNRAGKFYFAAVINKENLKFPDSSKIYIEPYYGPNYLRYDFGTFGDIKQPINTDISEIKQISDKVYFRIKIVDESEENGLLLGFADKLPLMDENEPSGKTSILYVNPIRMDTNEIWRLNFEADSEGMPILEVNNSIEGIKEIARSDSKFIAMVYPAAIREILKVISSSKNYDTEGESWTCKWMTFSKNVLGVLAPTELASDEAISDWMDDVIRAFCIRHKILENYNKSLDI